MTRPSQLRIVDCLKMLDMLEGNISYLNELYLDTGQQLTHAVNDFRSECDEDSLSELIRYLYWHSKLPASRISELTDISSAKLAHVAGPLCFVSRCDTCASEYTARKVSRRADYERQCSTCGNRDKIAAHRAFLVDWEHTDHLPEAVDKKSYAAYLNSGAWKKKRKIALKRAGYRCQLCSTKETRLEVHHNCYDRLGKEEPEDLCVLCSPCHKKHHNIQ